MTPAEVFAQFTSRPQDVRVIAPRKDGVEVDNNAMRFARTMGMQVESAQRTPINAAGAFDKLAPEQALRHFPELEGAYEKLAAARKFAERLPEHQRNTFVDMTKQRISQDLHEGKEVGMKREEGRTR